MTWLLPILGLIITAGLCAELIDLATNGTRS